MPVARQFKLHTLVDRTVLPNFRGSGFRAFVGVLLFLTAAVVLFFHTIHVVHNDNNGDAYIGRAELGMVRPTFNEKPGHYIGIGVLAGYAGLVFMAFVRDRQSHKNAN